MKRKIFLSDANPQKRRVTWTKAEQDAVERQLADYFIAKIPPGKEDCVVCLEKEAVLKDRRTWQQIKFFVINKIKSEKKKLANARKH